MFGTIRETLRRRREARALVKADAQSLIDQYGDLAHFQARLRQQGWQDGDIEARPPGHWERVKEAIRRQHQPG